MKGKYFLSLAQCDMELHIYHEKMQRLYFYEHNIMDDSSGN
jgi:hypothetical protein